MENSYRFSKSSEDSKKKKKVLLCLDIGFVAYNNAYTINTVFLHQVLASPVIVNENVSYPAGIINVCLKVLRCVLRGDTP